MNCFNNHRSMNIFFMLFAVDFGFILAHTNQTRNNGSTADKGRILYFENLDRNITPLIRKCCPPHTFYSTVTHSCVRTENKLAFKNNVNKLLANGKNYSYKIASEKIESCPETSQMPSIKEISEGSHFLEETGRIHDLELELIYNHTHYCLEMVGNDTDSSTLILAYCLGQQTIIPKCCPADHYFDTRISNCSPFYYTGEYESDVTLSKLISKNSILTYKENLCNDKFVEIDLKEAEFDGSNLCISKSLECYNIDKYCIDNMLRNEHDELVQYAFVCPENFLNKCCPDGRSLDKNGCSKAPSQSLSLIHFLKNSRYKVKSISNSGSQCSPITIEEQTKSDISWEIDFDGTAIINNGNKTIHTRNFCIDDFVGDNDVFLVLKVCSEEIQEYHEVSSIESWSENVLGKCCPPNMIYDPNLTLKDSQAQCIKKSENVDTMLEENVLRHYNLSHLVFSNFPKCLATEHYHYYVIGKSYNDYAVLTDNRTLKIVSTKNNCKLKATRLNASRFCIDFMVLEDSHSPVAIICAPKLNNVYLEKSAVIVSLVGVSCASLISAFFSLIVTRVRRGMITVKKINTLAGKILISYVTSLLIGYLVLGIGTLFDFAEETYKCFILAGFLFFFMIAAFCWNSSICLEGLLLTMHIQTSETRRYVYHSIWAWGVPAILTTVALVRDANRDQYPCDTITLKIGVERCFFSDLWAQLLYFYLPISITVILNAVLLIGAKMLRRSKLKQLEKDPNAIKKHENLHQVLSIKSIRRKIRKENSTRPTNHSGLRTHHNRNIWVESLKLVVWSGTTWLMEIIGTLAIIYQGRPQGEWYNYFWYLPVGFNCLRGLGIFIIISFNSENKVKLLSTARSVKSSFNMTISKFIPSSRSKSTRRKRQALRRKHISHQNNFCNVNTENEIPTNNRKSSGSTIITNLSSTTTATLEYPTEPSSFQIPKYFHSVSMTDPKAVPSSVLPNVYEECELERQVIVKFKEDSPDTSSLDDLSIENIFWMSSPMEESVNKHTSIRSILVGGEIHNKRIRGSNILSLDLDASKDFQKYKRVTNDWPSEMECGAFGNKHLDVSNTYSLNLNCGESEKEFNKLSKTFSLDLVQGEFSNKYNGKLNTSPSQLDEGGLDNKLNDVPSSYSLNMNYSKLNNKLSKRFSLDGDRDEFSNNAKSNTLLEEQDDGGLINKSKVVSNTYSLKLDESEFHKTYNKISRSSSLGYLEHVNLCNKNMYKDDANFSSAEVNDGIHNCKDPEVISSYSLKSNGREYNSDTYNEISNVTSLHIDGEGLNKEGNRALNPCTSHLNVGDINYEVNRIQRPFPLDTTRDDDVGSKRKTALNAASAEELSENHIPLLNSDSSNLFKNDFDVITSFDDFTYCTHL